MSLKSKLIAIGLFIIAMGIGYVGMKNIEPVVPVTETKPALQKTAVDGYHIEWRVPEGVNEVLLKYKESNGRVIYSYKLKVDPGQRLEIRGVE